MESDDLAPQIPRKRSRSPSVTPAQSTAERADNSITTSRLPKRLRRSHEIPDYHAPVEENVRQTMAHANPLSRKVLKREAKKARRAAGKAERSRNQGSGMDIDDDANLAFTFMSDIAA